MLRVPFLGTARDAYEPKMGCRAEAAGHARALVRGEAEKTITPAPTLHSGLRYIRNDSAGAARRQRVAGRSLAL